MAHHTTKSTCSPPSPHHASAGCSGGIIRRRGSPARRHGSQPQSAVHEVGNSGTISGVLWRRGWRWVAVALGSLALATTIAVAWQRYGLDKAAALATVLALLPIMAALFGWAHHFSRRRMRSRPDQIDAAAEMLARVVLQQWRAEAAIRQLLDPEPLAVRWKPTQLPAADHPEVAGVMSGRTNEIDQLIKAFLDLPHRRLVILGEPGAGKTTLALLFVLALINQRGPRAAVPVLLSAASWNPDEEHLHDWVERRLTEDYSELCDTSIYGSSAVHELVADRLVLPVIDGLDELPEGRRQNALRSANRVLIAGDPLVVTCRTTEYLAAVGAADVITGAAVIEAQPVRPAEVVAFLRRVIPPGPHGQRWEPIFAELKGAPDGDLAAALSTPLTVWLLRTVYAERNTDPGKLVDIGRFAGRTAIEYHLLESLVPTLIRAWGEINMPMTVKLPLGQSSSSTRRGSRVA
jgi:hypothetical protein